MDKLESFNQLYERLMALLSASTRGIINSTDLVDWRVESLDLIVKTFSAEMTAESLQNQIELIEQHLQSRQSRLNATSEFGEMETLRLQMAMDRLSKVVSTLSNVLKRISDTSQAIVMNLK
jgi:hypothetical protein